MKQPPSYLNPCRGLKLLMLGAFGLGFLGAYLAAKWSLA